MNWKKRRKYAVWLLLLGICFGLTLGCGAKELLVQVQKESNQVESVFQKEVQNPKQVPEAEIEHISQEKYGYAQLNEEGRQVYDEMLSAILNYQEKIMLSSMEIELMKKAYGALCADYGGLFWVEGYVFTKYTKGAELVGLEFSPTYSMTKEEQKQIQQQIDVVVEEWMSGISITDSEYNKAKYVYELLISNTTYEEGVENSQNIISVFLNQKTVCQGYACAVQYLLGQLGMESVIISGTALEEPHAWNLIRLDGEYYYMDVTWGKSGYRGQNTQQMPFVDYNYMTMTTQEMEWNHMTEVEFQLPQCTAVTNNYFRKEGTYIESFEPKII
ncbi:MAG: hypothetical protein RSD28_05110, partial [Lachnospiraceae bacterium]